MHGITNCRNRKLLWNNSLVAEKNSSSTPSPRQNHLYYISCNTNLSNEGITLVKYQSCRNTVDHMDIMRYLMSLYGMVVIFQAHANVAGHDRIIASVICRISL